MQTGQEDKAFFRPCPACGGDVHTVASRCKHCGAELRASLAAPQPPPAAGDPQPVEPPSVTAPPAPSAPPAPAAAAPPAPDPVPPPPRIEPAPPPAPAPAPAPIATASATARPGRWLWLAGAVLLLAIGMALGVIIERSGREEHAVRPALLETATHTAPRSLADPDFDFDPDFAQPPGGGFSLRITPFSGGRHRSGPNDGPAVDEFVQRIGGELCTKLADCADLDPTIAAMCHMVAGSIDTDDLADKISRGECRYDAGAAGDCIDGLSKLDCNSDQTDPFAMMAIVESMMSCTEAVSCM